VRLKGSVAFFTPIVISFVLILTNPVSRLVFFVDDAGVYRHGPAFLALYIIATGYFLLGFFAVILPKKLPSRAQRYAFISAILLPLIAMFIQNKLSGITLESFAGSIGTLVVLLTIQNSNELIDGSTGFFTRETFSQFLHQALSRKEKFTVLVVHAREIPSFQGIFDSVSYGKIVHSFDSWLVSAAGKYALVCALDEGLYAILPGVNCDDAYFGELALAVVARSKDEWTVDSLQIEIPVEIGILRLPSDGATVADVMALIDQLVAMPTAIGNRHIFSSGDLLPDRRTKDSVIQAALDSGSFQLRYQPIYSVEENRFVALEAIVGILGEGGEWIQQRDILKVAEQIGLSHWLGEAVLDRACQWFTENDLSSRGISSLQIRLLESQCVELDWPRSVSRILKDRNMAGSLLCLEITEPSVVNVGENLKLNMDLLSGQGVRFALDDYGSGYTDLGQILDMPFSHVKIDKEVVYSGLRTDKGERLLTGSVSLFTRLGLSITAEGIETPEQSSFLTGAGCAYLQGYQYSHPLDPAHILELLAKA
jgi:EAL domain-containing protein (putative c-di-GMP-specific phosphodiesterase class I)